MNAPHRDQTINSGISWTNCPSPCNYAFSRPTKYNRRQALIPMRLTIRWKFILSIVLTLLATYLALLSWDYRWQRETATLQAQDLAG